MDVGITSRRGGNERRDIGSGIGMEMRGAIGVAFGTDGLRDEHSRIEPAGGDRVCECGDGVEALCGASAGGSRNREATPTNNEQIE